MKRRQHKGLPDGKIGIGLLITNRVYVSKKHNSADVVTICMLLLKWDMPANTLVLWVRFPSGS